MENIIVALIAGIFSSAITVFVSKKINKAKFEVFIEQAKAKARIIEHEAEVALKDAQLKAKIECDKEFKYARKEYENMLFKIEKKEKELNDVVKKWVYNFPRSFLNIVKKDTSLNISQAKSISQGDTLTEYLLQTGSYLNDVTHNSSALDLFGLNIIFLSPDPSSLINLRNKYLAPFKPLDKIEQDSVSEAKGRLTNDYHIPVNDFIFKTWKEDDSIENLSSISMLIEMGNIRTLWLADASPTIVVAKLKEMGFSRDNPLECELVKVSHHGSNGNNSDELYSMIRCNSYFFSVNGENKYCLPSKECIVRILKNKQRLADQHYTLYFSYDNETLKSVFAIDSVDIYTKLNFTVHYQSDPFRTFHFD